MEELIRSTGGTEDELVNELLDNESPFLMMPHGENLIPDSAESRFLTAAPYSSPTVEANENALLYNSFGIHNFNSEVKQEAHRFAL